MKATIFLILNLFFCIGVSAQYKQMLHKPYKDRVVAIDTLYYNTVTKGRQDSLFVTSYSKKMKTWALAKGDKELALEAELLKAYSYLSIYGRKYPQLVQNLIPVAEKAKKEHFPNIEDRAAQAIAIHYWYTKNYVKSFEWQLRSDKIMEKMNPGDFPNMATHLNFIGRCHYFFKDYAKALNYYEKSSKLKKNSYNALAVIEAQNTLGLCYQKLGELDKAGLWFRKVIDDTSSFQSPVWKGIASGNLGYNYYLRNNYKKAIPLLKTDIAKALSEKDYGLAAGSTIPLTDIYLKQKRFKQSKEKIDEARTYIQNSGQSDRYRKLYPVMSKWFALNNRPDSSAAYLDLAMSATKAYNQKYNSLKLARANQQVQAKDQELEVGKLKAESLVKISQRNSIIIIVILLLGGSILAYWFRNKYLLKKQQVKELALENTQKALAHAKSQLENLTQKVHRDTKIVNQLKKGKPDKKETELLEELKTKNILTQDDWQQYQTLFKEVYPRFIPKLKSQYPELSPAERRCLCLERLKLSNNEMALLLGVSANTVIVTKHRIRKKLGLEDQNELEVLVENLG